MIHLVGFRDFAEIFMLSAPTRTEFRQRKRSGISLRLVESTSENGSVLLYFSGRMPLFVWVNLLHFGAQVSRSQQTEDCG